MQVETVLREINCAAAREPSADEGPHGWDGTRGVRVLSSMLYRESTQ